MFASQGLRTLVFGYKELSEKLFIENINAQIETSEIVLQKNSSDQPVKNFMWSEVLPE